MSYIDWNSIMGEIDMDFLKPLLDEVSNIYKDQWGEAHDSLISGDPYGSSTLETRLADEYSGYAGQAAKEKTAILSDFYKMFANNKYDEAMEEAQNRYDEMQNQYEDLQDQFGDYKDDVTEERKNWNKWVQDHNFPKFEKNNNHYSPVTTPGKNNTNNSSSSVWPPGGTIVNPSVITDYHPFNNSSPWGGSGGYYTGNDNYYYPPSDYSPPSYSDDAWWEYGVDYDEPAYAEGSWWDGTMSRKGKASNPNTANTSRKITSHNGGYNPPQGMITGALPNQSSLYNKPGFTARGGVPPRQMSRSPQNSINNQKPIIDGSKGISPPPGFPRPFRRRY